MSPNPGLPRGDLGCLGFISSLLLTITHKKRVFEGAMHLSTLADKAGTDHGVIPDQAICIFMLDVNEVCAGMLHLHPVSHFNWDTSGRGRKKKNRQMVFRRLKDMFCPD